MSKYSRDLSLHIPEDEPVFVLRARDALAPTAVTLYAALVRAAAMGVGDGPESSPEAATAAAVPLYALAESSDGVAAAMIAWQAGNPDEVDLPD